MQTNAPTTTALAGAAAPSSQKVLRNTYMLLAMTLLFSAIMAGVSLAVAAPHGVSLMSSLIALGLLWFVVPFTAKSVAGIGVVFAVTGLLGFGLGPILDHYLRMAHGGEIVMLSLGITGTTFMGLSAYAITSRRDFSFMRGFLAAGILVAFIAGLVALVAALLGHPMPTLSLTVSAMFALLMCGMILYRTGEIVNGGETNYVLATIDLYIALYNLFINLLHILAVLMGNRR